MKIKTKLTLWYTLLFAVLLSVVLAFLLTTGGKILFTSAENLLRSQIQEMSEEIELEDGKLELDDDFRAISKGVQLAVYEGDRLAAGQLPADFAPGEPLQPGVLRPVGAYLIYDFPVTGNIILRGCYSTESLTGSSRGILLTALIAAPMMLLLAAAGGHWITKRAFSPIDRIAETATQIGSSNNLALRINLPNTRDEVSALGTAFDGMLDRLEQSFQAEKQFSSDVSHELRTPVAVIQSQCEYALSGVNESVMRQSLLEIQSKTQDMSTLITQLLELSRAEHGTAAIHLERVDLSELVYLVAEELAATAEEKQISLTVDAQENIQVDGEQTLLLRLLLNLAGNAIKYTLPGGHVGLFITQTEEHTVLRVQDDGIGIASEHLEKIFRRFYRVDSSRHRDNQLSNDGYGLGLAFCQWIAKVHHAALTVKSVPGQGSEFSVLFPPCSVLH